MIKLEETVTGKMRGFIFHRIHQEYNKDVDKTYYIYEMKETTNNHTIAFEVFTPNIRKEPQKMPNGQFMPPGEVYPGTNDFGKNAMSIGGVHGSRREEGLKRAHQGILELIERDRENLLKKSKKKNAITK